MDRSDQTVGIALSGAALLDHLEETVVVVSLTCRGCGYNCKGLRCDGHCPECGLAVSATVVAVVDPDGSRLPRLSHPSRVGAGLLWLMVCALLATALLFGATVSSWFTSFTGSQLDWLGVDIGVQLPLAAGVMAFTGLWSVYQLMPPRGKEPSSAVWRDVWLIGGGLLAWSVLTVGWWRLGVATTAAMPGAALVLKMLLCAASVAVFLGIGGVLRTIGLRSLAYRRSRAGRQSVHTMIAAVIGVAVGAVVQFLATERGDNDWAIRGMVISTASGVMVMIGLIYLLANGWWIRTALRRPAPGVDQLVLPALPEDTHVPDAEGRWPEDEEDDNEEEDGGTT